MKWVGADAEICFCILAGMKILAGMNIRSLSLTVSVLAVALVPAGCRKDSPSNPSNSDYSSAIDAYYSAHPVCLWPDSVKMPTQQDTDKTDRTAGYDALTDIGYLQRLQATKKTFIFGSKQVSDYDLTPQGRSAWIADPTQPGNGNFCFGHRTVTSVDAATVTSVTDARTGAAANPDAPANATIQYHYAIKDAAAWAKNAGIQTAFPGVATMLAGPQADTATVTKTSAGWQMVAPNVPAPASRLGSPANDYGVVGQH